MFYRTYNGKKYDLYEDVEDFLSTSGYDESKLVYKWEIYNILTKGNIGKEAGIREITGKYFVFNHVTDKRKVPIMRILCYRTHKNSLELLFPIGWVLVGERSIKKLYDEFYRNLEFDFVAAFILTGDLGSSYKWVYGTGDVTKALYKFLDILEKQELKERIIRFMADNNMINEFDKKLPFKELVELLAEKLRDPKTKASEILDAMAYREKLAVVQNEVGDTLPQIEDNEPLKIEKTPRTKQLGARC